MVSSNVASEVHEDSLVFIKSCIRVLIDLDLASISKFTFPGSRLGFGMSSCGHLGFGFSQGACSMLFKFATFKEGRIIFYLFLYFKKIMKYKTTKFRNLPGTNQT
jgi:hypothetical protein